MRIIVRSVISVVVGLMSIISGCEQAPAGGPPTLRVGRDECLECGMLIAEDRCVAGLFVERNGRREHVLFDDIGCMLDVDQTPEARELVVLERWVRDYETRAWVSAEAAIFLQAEPETLHTPMGSGMVAFATRAEAERAQARHSGELVDYRSLAQNRKALMDARYGRSQSSGQTSR